VAGRNWLKERDFVLGSAVDFLTRWGGSATDVAATAVRCHYRGASPERATALLARDLEREVAARKHRAFENESRELSTMARFLEREGWRFLTIPGRPGGFFWHDQHGSINNMGGGFPTWEEAVKRTFNSAIRSLILQG
jgi:hypothetical protein